MAAPVNPLIIETVGLPGAGKTTVVERTLEVLRARDYRVLSRRDLPGLLMAKGGLVRRGRLAARLVSFGFRRPRLLASAVAVCRGKRSLNLPRAYDLATSELYLEEIARTDVDIVLLDQFLLQSLWSAALSRGICEPTRHCAFISEVQALTPFSVVHLRVDIDTALSRIEARPTSGSRFDRLEPQEARRLLVSRARLLEELVACSTTPPFELDAKESADVLAQRLVSFVERMMHRGGSGDVVEHASAVQRDSWKAVLE